MTSSFQSVLCLSVQFIIFNGNDETVTKSIFVHIQNGTGVCSSKLKIVICIITIFCFYGVTDEKEKKKETSTSSLTKFLQSIKTGKTDQQDEGTKCWRKHFVYCKIVDRYWSDKQCDLNLMLQ